MKQSLKKKEKIIQKTNNLFLKSSLTTIVEYKHTKSLEMKLVRQELFKNNIQIKIIKNTLTKKAISNTLHTPLKTIIKGQVLIIFSETEINLPLTILTKFIQNNINLKIKALCLYGKFFSQENINKVMELPSKKQALLNLIILLRTPLTNVLLRLQSPFLNLINLLKNKSQTFNN